MTKEQEIAAGHAISLLQESGAVFICLYGFPGNSDCYVEGMGDDNEEHRQKFIRALMAHWQDSPEENE